MGKVKIITFNYFTYEVVRREWRENDFKVLQWADVRTTHLTRLIRTNIQNIYLTVL